MTDLDRAWEAINGMAKPGRNLSTYEDGWNDALAGALGIVEALGGRDPCTLPKEERDELDDSAGLAGARIFIACGA